MARRERFIEPGSWQHLIFRGVNGEPIVLDAFDRERLLERAPAIFAEEDTLALMFALMRNHMHLIVRAGANVPRAMQRLLGGHTVVFNKRHDRFGPLYSDRYFNKEIVSAPQLRIAIMYVALNPMRAGIVDSIGKAAKDRNSGLGALLGFRDDPLVDPAATRLFGETVETARDEVGRRIEWVLNNPKELDEYELFLQAGNVDEALDSGIELLEEDAKYVFYTSNEDAAAAKALTQAGWTTEELLRWAAKVFGQSEDLIRQPGRAAGDARALVVYFARYFLGVSNKVLAETLSVSPGRITQLFQAGRKLARVQEHVLPDSPIVRDS